MKVEESMDILNIVWAWITTHKLLTISGALNLDYAVLLAAQQAGYTKVVTVCKAIANFIGFIVNVLKNLATGPTPPTAKS